MHSQPLVAGVEQLSFVEQQLATGLGDAQQVTAEQQQACLLAGAAFAEQQAGA